MDKAFVLEIARQISDQQADFNWKFFLALIFSQLLLWGVAIYFGAYLKKKAETFATQEDFVEIKNQLIETTRITKEIEISLSHNDWLLNCIEC
ncbi:hypothetical protein ACIPF8_17510 [Collimonas sp. NPDC087041]|uniref:hypothetical protein n=1 Tax=Collimonas sp. NPDC087041 TaxID=3363960 RepID=UPI0038204533